MPEPQLEVTQEEDEKIREEGNEEKFDENGPPPMKHSETRDSISSIDSDVCLSFDKEKTKRKETTEDEGANLADMSDSASDTGSAGGKDSGCEVTLEVKEPPFTPPSDELADKIVAQVEFYFSDVNITKDAFLLKHVKRNKEGYVSLKLISSFKRVKHLTKDWRVVAHSLIRSKKLEINESGTKLRRLDPLPQYDQTAPSRTIVAVHMPIEKPTIENVAELFTPCGEIALIRVLRPGNPIPADVRQFINKNPSLNGVVCALVEFVDSESARNAIQMQNTVGEPLKVYELNGIPNNERKKKSNQNKKNFINKIVSESDNASSSEAEEFKFRIDQKGRIRRGSSAYFPPKCSEPIAWLQRRLSASSTEAGFMMLPRRLSASSRDSSESSLYLSRRVSACSLSGSDCGSFNRRMSSCSQTSESSGPRSRSNSSAFHLPENILRLPQGPDGSKGFKQRFNHPICNN